MSELLGQIMGGQGGQLLGAVSGLVDKAGGLDGLLGLLQKSGLDDQVKSWISTGQNKQVSSQQLQQALGDDKVAAVAQQAGVSKDEAASGLADLLPQLVDKLSPDGKLPDASSLQSMLGGLLK